MMNSFSRLFASLLSGCALLGAPSFAATLHAQEVVQALPDPANEQLTDALRRLSRNPESVPALVSAGRASLDLGDMAAALGFFARAQDIAPEDGRVLTGLALIAVRRGEAVTALQLFDNAEAAGVQMMPYAADRGLAYDLVGRNDTAQRYYRRALAREDSTEIRRRLALSYAISGEAEESENTLLPLLQRQDRSAFRARAFALAIAGRDEEAVAIAETMLPQRLSRRLEPYLRYMPRLTPAQQAAAANLGQFPSMRDIGEDSAQIASYSQANDPSPSSTASATRPAPAADRLEPQGAPLGPASSQPTAQAPAQVARSGELPAIGEAPGGPTAAATPPRSVASQPAAQVAEVVTSRAPAAEPQQPTRSVARVQPIPQPSAEAPSASQREAMALADAFADFTLQGSQAPTNADAVDITSIDPPRERPQPAEPAPPQYPSRHWVQVATGQDVSAFRFDWRRIVRNAGSLLDDADAFTADWGQTNRLLTGPFDSAREAQAFVSALAGEGVDSFRFTSEEGEEIQPLD